MQNQNWSERLDARVRAFNRVNKRANELHSELVEIFRTYVGKKILTNAGFVAKLRPQWEAIRDREGHSHGGFQVYYSGSTYSLTFTVKTWEPYNGEQYGGAYAEANIHVGDFGGRRRNSEPLDALPADHLATLNEQPVTLRTDYNADEVRRLRKEADELRDKLSAAESALHPFGRFDQ